MAKKKVEVRNKVRKPSEAQAYARAFEKKVINHSSDDLEEMLGHNAMEANIARGKISRLRVELSGTQSWLKRLSREKGVLDEILDGRIKRMAGGG